MKIPFLSRLLEIKEEQIKLEHAKVLLLEAIYDKLEELSKWKNKKH
jgi:hypothetical protein